MIPRRRCPEDIAAIDFIYRVYTVFNASQIEGIPAHNPACSPGVGSNRRRRDNSAKQRSPNHLMTNRIEHSTVASDTIHLPPGCIQIRRQLLRDCPS